MNLTEGALQCGSGGILHTVGAVGVDGEGHHDIGVFQHLLAGRGVDAFIGERGGEGLGTGTTKEAAAWGLSPTRFPDQMGGILRWT